MRLQRQYAMNAPSIGLTLRDDHSEDQRKNSIESREAWSIDDLPMPP
jgi:hypothetical protein